MMGSDWAIGQVCASPGSHLDETPQRIQFLPLARSPSVAECRMSAAAAHAFIHFGLAVVHLASSGMPRSITAHVTSMTPALTDMGHAAAFTRRRWAHPTCAGNGA